MGVLEIGHEHVRARVQRVDDHLAIYRSGDFYASVEQIGGNWRHLPFCLPNLRRFREKVGHLPGFKFLLAYASFRQQFLATRFELSRQIYEERPSFRAQNLGLDLSDGEGGSGSHETYDMPRRNRLPQRNFITRTNRTTCPMWTGILVPRWAFALYCRRTSKGEDSYT